jgi:tetratricopeptide (TPR) repeat protein
MKRKTFHSIVFILLSFSLIAQEIIISPSGATYAVVVGISDYQDERIPDLRFADKDALAFANFLNSPAGGSLDEDQMRVLINEDATGAQFHMALDWLIEKTKEGDKVIIYFSGHGDVEAKRITTPGYLLGWDAPSRVYAAGGTMKLMDLKEVVSTLSVYNKAKVILITDACRSGKLSGSNIDGTQLTSQNLTRLFENEIKILSCQPNEYSIEGEQWGGGRGAFSYHLIDGLYGMADENQDLSVNLMEIGRYLQDKVSTEVAPQSQVPMTVGNFTEIIADVIPEQLDNLREVKKSQLQLFIAIETKGMEEKILASSDTIVQELYVKFKKAVEEKKFLSPEKACADYYYEQLMAVESINVLHSNIRRNYSAALQDDAQQVLNKLLKSDPGENSKTLISINRDYVQFPKNLRRAAELLGEDHYMYSILMARSYWFEGYIEDESRCACKNIDNANKVLPYYQKALTYQPEMPYAWVQMAAVYGIQKQEPDSAEYYANLAIDAVSGWDMVHNWMANGYLNQYASLSNKQSLAKAKEWLDKGLEANSNSVNILNQLAYWYNLKGQFQKEQETLDRSFEITPIAQTMSYKGEGYLSWGKYEKAEKAFLKSVELDSSLYFNPSGLMKLYYDTKQYKKLVNCYASCFELGFGLPETHYDNYGEALLFTIGPERTIDTLKQLLFANPEKPGFHLSLCATYVKMGHPDLAMEHYNQAMTINPSIKMCTATSNLFFFAEYWEYQLMVGKEAFKLEPNNYFFTKNKSGTLLAGGKYDESFKTAEKFLENNPNEQYNLIVMAQNYYLRNDLEKAEQYLNKALNGPIRRIARVQLVLGMVYEKAGRFQKAEQMLKLAIDSDEGDAPILWNGYYFRIDRFKKDWEKTLIQLLQWYPNNHEIHLELSKLYANSKDDEKSLTSLDLALKNGYQQFDELPWEANLRPLKENNLEAWNELMQKYLPSQLNE